MRITALIPFAAATAVMSTGTRSTADVRGDRPRYTAFELVAGKLEIDGLPSGITGVSGSPPGDCAAAFADGKLSIERGKDLRASCRAIFANEHPAALTLVMANAKGATTVVIPFDGGTRGVVEAEYDPTKADNHTVMLTTKATGTLAFHARGAKTWSSRKVTAGKADLDSDEITPGTDLYLKVDNSDDVLEVPWHTKAVVDPPSPAPEPGRSCEVALAQARSYAWTAVLDSENPTNSLEVVRNPSTEPLVEVPVGAASAFDIVRMAAHNELPRAIIEPNAFGLVVVRHPDTLTPTFDADFSKVGVVRPGHDPGVGQGGAERTPSALGAPTAAVPKYVCTTYQVAPHKPGAFQVKVTLPSPPDSAQPAPTRTRNLDVVVLDRYVGAFRTGVALIGFAPDRKFEARTAVGASQAEIVQTEESPVEVVVGYSVFGSTFLGGSRSYFNHRGAPCQDGRWGLYLGFGAVSFSGADIKFLKSLHLGAEFEIGPHLSIAVTGVLRRVDELALGEVGGPAPASPATVATRSTYEPGMAVVVNISPSFFKFAANIGK